MAKGYWIAHVTVTDPERYKDYVAANAAAFEKYNARFLVRGGSYEQRAGAQKQQRHVVLEFDSYATAKPIMFDPLALLEGVEAVDDPILLVRPGAYAVSFGRRIE